MAHVPVGDANYGVSSHLRFGVDRLAESPTLAGPIARAGLITNDAARLATDASCLARVALLRAGLPLVRLFGPEHGLGAVAADGAAVADSVDPDTALPVVSLYGEHLRPTREMVRDLDTLLFDIPDVGARFYTYTWTLFHAMSACAEYGTRLVVLDRPNPLGGDISRAEGPLLEPDCASFVGNDDIPVTHQLTLGELARLWQREHFPSIALEVVAAHGWRRHQRWSALQQPWIATSPSMPSFESAEWYPGMCLFEATNLSVGRGTNAPFQRLGAPWLNADRLIAHALSRHDIELVRDDFTPTLAPYVAEHCVGVRLYGDAVQTPVPTGLLLLASVIATHTDHFAWTGYPTAANPSGADHFERLIGTRLLRPWLEQHPATVSRSGLAKWIHTSDWRARVEPILLYD